MKIYLIKVQNFVSEEEEVICAYDNEESAIQHVASYKMIYNSELSASIWYDSVIMKSSFV